jgi:hypothetical protein
MDEVEELEPTRTHPLAAAAAARTSDVAALGNPDELDELDELDDVTLAALLRQTARLRAIELQLAAVYDLRSHTEAMRGASTRGSASDCA